MWVLTSVTTVKVNKNESEVESKCYEQKKTHQQGNANGLWQRGWPPPFTAIAQERYRVSLRFTTVLQLGSNFGIHECLQGKKVSTNGFHQPKARSKERLGLKNEQNRLKGSWWKIVAKKRTEFFCSKLKLHFSSKILRGPRTWTEKNWMVLNEPCLAAIFSPMENSKKDWVTTKRVSNV